MTHRARTILLVLDLAALVGLVAFSVLGALNPDTRAYVVAQILCATVVLGSVLLLRWIGHPPPAPPAD